MFFLRHRRFQLLLWLPLVLSLLLLFFHVTSAKIKTTTTKRSQTSSSLPSIIVQEEQEHQRRQQHYSYFIPTSLTNKQTRSTTVVQPTNDHNNTHSVKDYKKCNKCRCNVNTMPKDFYTSVATTETTTSCLTIEKSNDNNIFVVDDDYYFIIEEDCQVVVDNISTVGYDFRNILYNNNRNRRQCQHLKNNTTNKTIGREYVSKRLTFIAGGVSIVLLQLLLPTRYDNLISYFTNYNDVMNLFTIMQQQSAIIIPSIISSCSNFIQMVLESSMMFYTTNNDMFSKNIVNSVLSLVPMNVQTNLKTYILPLVYQTVRMIVIEELVNYVISSSSLSSMSVRTIRTETTHRLNNTNNTKSSCTNGNSVITTQQQLPKQVDERDDSNCSQRNNLIRMPTTTIRSSLQTSINVIHRLMVRVIRRTVRKVVQKQFTKYVHYLWDHVSSMFLLTPTYGF